MKSLAFRDRSKRENHKQSKMVEKNKKKNIKKQRGEIIKIARVFDEGLDAERDAANIII